jgi:orotidine-5'-phosphate decarboxylase
VVGATYPKAAKRARELMPNTFMLVPGYGAQGAGATEAVAALTGGGTGAIVSASRSIMYAYRLAEKSSPPLAAAAAAEAMRVELNKARRERMSAKA